MCVGAKHVLAVVVVEELAEGVNIVCVGGGCFWDTEGWWWGGMETRYDVNCGCDGGGVGGEEEEGCLCALGYGITNDVRGGPGGSEGGVESGADKCEGGCAGGEIGGIGVDKEFPGIGVKEGGCEGWELVACEGGWEEEAMREVGGDEGVVAFDAGE